MYKKSGNADYQHCHSTYHKKELFLCEEFLSLVFLNELLCENISSSLWRLVHADTLNHLLECTSLEGCDCFLCHFLFLLNYLISR